MRKGSGMKELRLTSAQASTLYVILKSAEEETEKDINAQDELLSRLDGSGSKLYDEVQDSRAFSP